MGRRTGAKAKAKSKPQSFQDERRSRILQMQRLYGLANEQSEDGSLEDRNSDAMASPAFSTQSVLNGPRMQKAADGIASEGGGVIPSADHALTKLQASLQSFEPEASTVASSTNERTQDPWELPTVPEDPFGLTELGSSGGLIAWSKNLRPEELSPSASLAAFFPAPVI